MYKDKKELTLKMNEDCLVLKYEDKVEIIMVEPGIHLANNVEDVITNRFGLSKKIGRIIRDKVIGLYLSKSYPVVKTKKELFNE